MQKSPGSATDCSGTRRSRSRQHGKPCDASHVRRMSISRISLEPATAARISIAARWHSALGRGLIGKGSNRSARLRPLFLHFLELGSRTTRAARHVKADIDQVAAASEFMYRCSSASCRRTMRTAGSGDGRRRDRCTPTCKIGSRSYPSRFAELAAKISTVPYDKGGV